MPSKFSGARWTLRERFTLAGISQLQAHLRTAALTLTESCERLRFDTNQGYLGESVRALRAILNNKEEQR